MILSMSYQQAQQPHTHMSEVSETDLKLFLNLANNEKVTEERNDDIDEDDGEEDEDDDDEENEGEEDEDEGEEDEDEPPPARAPSRVSSRPPVAWKNDINDDDDVADTPEETLTPEEIAFEKSSTLMELQRLKNMGIQLTREFTMNDSLADMSFELRKQLLLIEESNMVSTLKDGLKIFVSSVEMANEKFGPFLHLSGFSQTVSQDINNRKFDQPLQRIHRKYFRSTGAQMAPELEIALGLASSMAMHHFRRGYLDKILPSTGGGAKRSMPNSMRDIPPAADDSDDEELPPAFQ